MARCIGLVCAHNLSGRHSARARSASGPANLLLSAFGPALCRPLWCFAQSSNAAVTAAQRDQGTRKIQFSRRDALGVFLLYTTRCRIHPPAHSLLETSSRAWPGRDLSSEAYPRVCPLSFTCFPRLSSAGMRWRREDRLPQPSKSTSISDCEGGWLHGRRPHHEPFWAQKAERSLRRAGRRTV